MGRYYYPHFIEEQTCLGRLSDLSKCRLNFLIQDIVTYPLYYVYYIVLHVEINGSKSASQRKTVYAKFIVSVLWWHYSQWNLEVTSWFLPFYFIIIIFINLFYFIYFWLCWVFVASRGLSLVVASGSYSSLWCAGCSLWWLLLLWSMGSRCMGFSSCGMRAQ